MISLKAVEDTLESTVDIEMDGMVPSVRDVALVIVREEMYL
jgi:hypothetical protein